MRSKTWIIQSVKNGFSHRPKEHALSEATTEASRLATQNPTDEFLIYGLVRSVKVQNIVIEDVLDSNAAGDEDSFPFNPRVVR